MNDSAIKKLDGNFEGQSAGDGVAWTDARELTLEGRGFAEAGHPYDRLPATSRGRVSDAVWSLQQHSAGMCVRFVTDSPTVDVRWRLRFSELGMSHMPATGVSGVDLYAAAGGRLRFAGIGIPSSFPENTARLPGSQDGRPCTFQLYLPLYNGVDSVEIAVSPGSALGPAASEGAGEKRPICFYGTSITQGGCASRPGMACPAIVGRFAGHPIINLGFSGSARAEPELALLLARLDPAAYVLDSLPNMETTSVAERMEGMVQTLRVAHPRTPIVLVEHIRPTRLRRLEEAASSAGWEQSNVELRGVFSRHQAADQAVQLVPWQELLGDDEEATVDGIHPTDLGFARMASPIAAAVTSLLRRRQA